MSDRLLPNGFCWCGCGKEVGLGKFFRQGHDKISEAAIIATAASTGHEQDKANEQARIRTIRTTVEKIVERDVYRNVCFDDDGLRALSAAIKPGDAAAKSGNAVP